MLKKLSYVIYLASIVGCTMFASRAGILTRTGVALTFVLFLSLFITFAPMGEASSVEQEA